MAAIFNPSLGELGRVPPELRNRIYRLAIDTTNDRLDIFSLCTGPRRQLALVSKQIHNETINLIKTFKHKPCAHWNFTIRKTTRPRQLWGSLVFPSTIFYEADRINHDLLKPGASFRFFTAHICEGAPFPVPVAVVVTLPGSLSGPKNQLQLKVEVVRAARSEKGSLTLSVRMPCLGPGEFDGSMLHARDFVAKLTHAVIYHVLKGTGSNWVTWECF
ncbi:hypothetical protein BDY17DRAFT_294165 [Neohortaea acidophila]|uniref:F-box domain-containing protein n=1 Tax=Neohortaea acidophila TaxID=245834 RepID=A0A6A6Q0F9_9PEZI|nr:uncharacterized protein BDY17DRAFT_294165 [Neohortaea acidophila]KAF2485745.1 hypothetical protein BDY17DRAFT_294165 [Neohortaea acidophila]